MNYQLSHTGVLVLVLVHLFHLHVCYHFISVTVITAVGANRLDSADTAVGGRVVLSMTNWRTADTLSLSVCLSPSLSVSAVHCDHQQNRVVSLSVESWPQCSMEILDPEPRVDEASYYLTTTWEKWEIEGEYPSLTVTPLSAVLEGMMYV